MNSPPKLPSHIAIVMDGNGRWAQRRNRPRTMGHQAGLKALRRTVEHCAQRTVPMLTVFAFSSENWNRPKREVSRLMDLFLRALGKEVKGLHENDIRIRFIGEVSAFQDELQARIVAAEQLTRDNHRMTLNVAANYGGRWDIVQAARAIARDASEGRLNPEDIDEKRVAEALSLSSVPDPDLFIRTGGEMRISNFLLWQTAYSELYFTDVLWPDFGPDELDRAIDHFQQRERRFGRTTEQVRSRASA